MSIQVLGNRLLLKVRGQKETIKTAGGVMLPKGVNVATEEVGEEVINIGNEVKGFKIGDRVVRIPRTGYGMVTAEGKVLFIDVHDILCKL